MSAKKLKREQKLLLYPFAIWFVFILIFALESLGGSAYAMARGAPTPVQTQQPTQPTPQWEVPAKFVLSEAMSRAFNQSFQSRVEYEHQIQARHTAKAAYLNLLPHLSISSVLSLVTPSTTGILGVIGDLAPFLLPSRWFQARDARLMSQAERQVLALMRADSAAQVEGLAYALARDQQILERYNALMDLAVKTRDQLQTLETQGQMPEGSTDHLNATINLMALDMAGLTLIIHEDRIVLAQAMGFQNPEAVLELALDPESIPIGQARPIDTDPATTQAIQRSYELAQMNQLIVLAANQKRELDFNWLDPAGDYTAALGFGLGETIAVARSRIQELRVKREQIQSAVAEKVAEAVAEYDVDLTTYSLAQSGVALSARRMTRVLAQIGPGSNLNTLDVEAVFQDSLASAIRSEAMLAAFRVARSRIDRFLLQGWYAGSAASNPSAKQLM
jgi:hypothetical protein